jgi:Co/Zn/Cd efflux system component
MRALRSVSVVVLWIPFAAWMVVAYQRQPSDPARAHEYGTNLAGVLAGVLTLSVVEVAIATALLQTWRSTPNRTLQWLAVSLVGVWSPLSCGLAMHQGSVLAIHAVWALALFVFCVVWYVRGWRPVQRAARKPSSASR